MDAQSTLTCLFCIVPWILGGLLGGLIGWVMRGRAAVLGMPWALLPWGGWVKKQWEDAK